ncbi:AraD1 family protein [Glacieibacterium frigidum]|uniref:FAH family protein n=1 Tax=Glacieibacterium frigidum TaxID=2593303 RepID=A0A552UHR8_9SPHN|nr:FAH family protein [Glacieibacterium frigidum]
MTFRLVQIAKASERIVAASADGADWRRVAGVASIRELAQRAIDTATGLEAFARASLSDAVDVAAALDEGRLLPPIDHPDPAHVYLTGTGLTHLGSAHGRDQMHRTAVQGVTDSMRMFQSGLEGGKPPLGEIGSQPEWFYKGNGNCLVGTGADLSMPAFARDGGEEPEIAGIYLIDGAGQPRRLGYALANEFSDHVTERENYLYLAHSKLRAAALGPELIVGDLPAEVVGVSRIRRGGSVLWEKPFLSGEANMSHTLANLEHHHFKYALFRQPGDVHVHFFGTATLSFADGIQTAEGDVFEIEAAPFTLPLRNRLVRAADTPVRVEPL